MTVPGVEVRVRHARDGFVLDVDLRLPGGGITGLFGASGAGKTTLLRCVAGLERPAEATVRVAGATWQDAANRVPVHRRPVGLVFQDARLFRHMSVRDNLMFGWRRAAPSRRRLAFDDVVALLDLGPLLARRAAALSGGETQRVAIGRALLAGPDLLLLDEPLASVDAARKGEILPFLERLHRELAIPAILVTHDIDDVVRLADTVVLLEKGRVVAQGPVAATLAHLGGGAALAVAFEVTVAAHPAGVIATLPDDRRVVLPERHTPGLVSRRLLIAARDVSLGPPGRSSALFTVEARVVRVSDDASAYAAVTLAGAGTTLLALVPRHACMELGLVPGATVHAAVHHARLA